MFCAHTSGMSAENIITAQVPMAFVSETIPLIFAYGTHTVLKNCCGLPAGTT